MKAIVALAVRQFQNAYINWAFDLTFLGFKQCSVVLAYFS